jgi:peroxiredoxin
MESKEISSVEIGSPVPEFRLPSNTGKNIGVGEYKDRSNLVLFFVREFN